MPGRWIQVGAGSMKVLYEDDVLLGLDKPSGLLSVPGVGPDKKDCLATRVQRDFPGATVLHRLDRDTSGVMILARTAEAHRMVSKRVLLNRPISLLALPGPLPAPMTR